MRETFLIINILSSLFAFGQEQKLQLIFVSHESESGNDALLQAFGHFIPDIKKMSPEFNYSKYFYTSTNNFPDNPELVKESTIGTMKAADFIIINKQLSNKLIPIFIINKDTISIQPYYSAYFIVNKNCNINSLNSSEIKKIFYVNELSASGYFAPINQLWESGVIPQPSLKSAIATFGQQNVVKADSHQNVIKEVSDDNTFSSIGFCGDAPDSNSKSTILLRYSYFPQDVIFVSQNLQKFIPEIKRWFNENPQRNIFKKSSTKITGIYDYDSKVEYGSAYKNLEHIIDRVIFCEHNPETKKFKYGDINTPRTLFAFLNELTFKEIAAIIAILVTIFSAGVTIALKYPKIIAAFKTTKNGS